MFLFIWLLCIIYSCFIIWIISIGWFLLTTTLFINLLSHYIASKNNTKAVQDIDDEKELITKPEYIADFLGVNFYQPGRVQAIQREVVYSNDFGPDKMFFEKHDKKDIRMNPHRG